MKYGESAQPLYTHTPFLRQGFSVYQASLEFLFCFSRQIFCVAMAVLDLVL